MPCNIKHVVTFIPKTETHEGKRMTIERVLYLRFLFSAPSPTHTREHAHAHVCELQVQSCEDVEQSSTVRARCRVSERQGRAWGIPKCKRCMWGPSQEWVGSPVLPEGSQRWTLHWVLTGGPRQEVMQMRVSPGPWGWHEYEYRKRPWLRQEESVSLHTVHI